MSYNNNIWTCTECIQLCINSVFCHFNTRKDLEQSFFQIHLLEVYRATGCPQVFASAEISGTHSIKHRSLKVKIFFWNRRSAGICRCIEKLIMITIPYSPIPSTRILNYLSWQLTCIPVEPCFPWFPRGPGEPGLPGGPWNEMREIRSEFLNHDPIPSYFTCDYLNKAQDYRY